MMDAIANGGGWDDSVDQLLCFFNTAVCRFHLIAFASSDTKKW